MIISIQAKDIELTDELRAYTEQKMEGLFKFFDNVIDVKVHLVRTTQHHQKGDIFKASAEMALPGKTLHAEEVASDMKLAVNGLKDSMTREIKNYKGHLAGNKKKDQREVRRMKEGGEV